MNWKIETSPAGLRRLAQAIGDLDLRAVALARPAGPVM